MIQSISKRLLGAGLLSVLLTTAAAAQSGEAVRIRGTVASIAGTKLTVEDREGRSTTVQLADDWKVSGVAPAKLSDIQPGSFIGTAAVPQPGGGLRALEVVVFPPGAKGREGHFAWDLLPESTMTNAIVAETVTGVDGPTFTLTYQGGEQTVTVPDGVPVVTIAGAERTDVVPGAPIVVFAQRGADGSASSGQVMVGNHGVAPPM